MIGETTSSHSASSYDGCWPYPNMKNAKPLRIRCCSWNLNGTGVSEQDPIASLVAPDGVWADVIAVGVQECVPLSPWNVVFDDHLRIPDVHTRLTARLSGAFEASGRSYVKVATVGLVGLFIVVFVRQDLEVSQVECDRIKTGAFGTFGNKGGVCIRFTVAHWALCFINVHLDAGLKKAVDRMNHLMEILRDAFQERSHDGHLRQRKSAFNFFRNSSEHVMEVCHATMIFGDFNFRLELPHNQQWPVGEFSDWLQFDEWVNAQDHVSWDLDEGKIEFRPTYRYERKSSKLDRKRIPAWCDRVLYNSMPFIDVKVLDYRAILEMRNTSDHLPVTALLEIGHAEAHQALRPSRRKKNLLRPSKTLLQRIGGSLCSCWPCRDPNATK
jgi:phosphatidylinositol-bisphosphatase